MRVISGTSRGSLRGGNTASSSAPSSGVSVDMPPTSSGVAPVFASDSDDTRSDSEDVVEQSINSRRAQEPPAVSLGPAPSSGPAASPGPSPSGGGFTRLSLKKVLISYVITILN
ncbi:unnamed protein product [Mucor circinelloides]